MNKIIINAPALRAGGGLTILLQFIEAIPDDEYMYLLFADSSVNVDLSKINLQIVSKNVNSFYKRLLWDTFGLKKWLKHNGIIPITSISLQNTNFRLDVSCPNYIYYHQPLPLFPFKWNFFKSQERILWFYKNIYPFFVKLFVNSSTQIFVQLNYIKDGFAQKYNFPKEKIHVVFPKIEIPLLKEEFEINIDSECINLFYPATSIFYKNHSVLFESFTLIDKQLLHKIVLYLTTNKDDFDFPKKLKNVEFVFLGQISYKEVIWMFQNVNALLFPSYIETLGLPLIEAASFGLPIITSDLPYSHEVLEGYKGVTYIDYKSPKAWGMEILKLTKEKDKRFELYKKEDIKSWSDFFKIIKENL